MKKSEKYGLLCWLVVAAPRDFGSPDLGCAIDRKCMLEFRLGLKKDVEHLIRDLYVHLIDCMLIC